MIPLCERIHHEFPVGGDRGRGDLCDLMRRQIERAEVVVEQGATVVYAAATHPILSGDAVTLIEQSPIKEMVFTDTIPIPPEKKLPNMTVISIAPLLGEAIKRIHTGQSVGALFNGSH